MNLRLMSAGEKKKIIKVLNERFGISEDSLNYTFLESGKDKIRIFSGHMTRDDLKVLGEVLRVEGVGLYCVRRENFGLRLGFDATQLFAAEIKEGFLDLNGEEFELWMRGQLVHSVHERGIYVVKFNGDCVGCGYHDGTKLINYVPRERQFK